MATPDDRSYRSSHEWATPPDDGVITVGITEFAQEQLGDVVFVELPAPGDRVTEGDAVAVVESVKTASDIYAPVSGTVTEVNDALETSPEKINDDPYGDGWIFKLRVDDEGDLEDLLDAGAYDEVAEAEA